MALKIILADTPATCGVLRAIGTMSGQLRLQIGDIQHFGSSWPDLKAQTQPVECEV